MHANTHTQEIEISKKLSQITLYKKNNLQLLHQLVKYIIRRENYRSVYCMMIEKSLTIH